MKTGIATTISVAGVIVAGVAAFAVNNTVLSASSAAGSEIVSTNRPAGATPVNSGSVSAAVAKATPINDTTTTYAVGSAGSVVIDTATGAAVVTGIAPGAGFTSEPAVTDSMGVVTVRFKSTRQHLNFIAQMVNGQVKVSVNDVTPPSLQSAPTRPDHEDDDDHDEDENHDDDRHGDKDDHDDEDHEDEDDD
jgi:hypothetical protein